MLEFSPKENFSLPLGELSSLNAPPEDHLLVVLKSYFDCSNHAGSSLFDCMSIGVTCGSGILLCNPAQLKLTR